MQPYPWNQRSRGVWNKSYWIKTVAMHTFKEYLLGEQMYDPDDPKLQGSRLSNYIIKIFEKLRKCLTGENGRIRPFMSSFNVPFKNILHSKSKLDSDDEEASYLDEAQLDILCRRNIVAANDINRLITLFNRLNSKDADATCELLELKNKNSEAKRKVYDEGIREKLGILLYQHFEIEEPELLSSNTKPLYVEFIRKNLPAIKIIELEKGNEDTIEYDCIVTILPIRLIENDEIVNLGPMLEKARRRINYWSLEAGRNMRSDYHRNDFDY